MTDTYKVLGQAKTTGSNTVGVAYTVPSATQTAMSNTTILNTGTSAASYSLFAVPASEYSSIFVPASSGWEHLGSTLSGDTMFDNFGWSVALSDDGTIMAVGIIGNDTNGEYAGQVRIYQWTGSSWVQRGQSINGEASGDNSGASVALSSDGTILAIGANGNSGTGPTAGHVRVYQWTGSAWTQIGSDIDGESEYDNFGVSVSLSNDGTVLAVGAQNASFVNVAMQEQYLAGHVRVYYWNGSSWIQRGADIDGEAYSDYSGLSVSLSGNGSIVAIGAYGNDGNGTNSGHVRVYQWNGSFWQQVGSDIDGEAENNYSGSSVAISDNGLIVAIGARGNNNDTGHVRIYEFNGSAWIQKGLDIDGQSVNDNAGWSVAISNDGLTVAIGERYNGDGGNGAGQVRIFEWGGSSWTQVGTDIEGASAFELAGTSVAISGDGSIVSLGSLGGVGTTGLVRAYEYVSTSAVFQPANKHAIIKSRNILAGEVHTVTGGIMLNSGDNVLLSADTSDVVVSMFGTEIS